jgi:hypothetical protein
MLLARTALHVVVPRIRLRLGRGGIDGAAVGTIGTIGDFVDELGLFQTGDSEELAKMRAGLLPII